MQSKPQESSENNFLDLLNFIVDPAVIVDEKGRILLLNNAFEEITGLSKKIIGTVFLDVAILTAETKKIFLANLKRRMQGLPVPPYEITFTGKNGETLHVEVKAKKFNYAGQPADLVLFRDITRRKRNLSKLKKYSEKMEALVEEKIKATKDSEEKLRAITDSALDAMFMFDKEDTIVYWNPAAEKIFGYTKAEIIGKKVNATLVPPHFRKEHINLANKLPEAKMIENKDGVWEFPALRKGGITFSMELSMAPLQLNNKRYVVAIARDITEHKQIETKLREAEKRYRALFKQAPVGILLVDPETAKAVKFNEEAHRQLGYSGEEFAKLSVSNYEVIETPEETRTRMKKVLKTGRDEFETKHRTKTGELRDVINIMQVIELAGKKLFHVITRDITEQKKMEHELKLERDKLEAVTENIGAGLGIISTDYRVLWVNNYLQQSFRDCEGKKCYSVFNKLDDVCPDCGVRKIIENGVSLDRHEYSFKDPAGNPLWVELISTPIKDKKGNIIAALELTIDITEKKLLQNKLKEYSEKLEQLVEERTEQLKQTQTKLLKAEKLAAIGELAGMIGHDLRNPLTGIKGAAYYLKTKYAAEINDTGKDMLTTIENAIDHSNKIINDLLDYSSKLNLEYTATTPKLLLKDALSFIEVPERIQIIDAAKDKPKIKVDIGSMRKVFANIITNAMDAMPVTGTLTITSSVARGNVKFTFKDTGTGMTEETLSKLKLGFPLFTTKARGMGFGLPICKRIIEAHGGKISLKSTLGKGTTVTIAIPVNPKPADAGEEKWIFNDALLQALRASNKHREN